MRKILFLAAMLLLVVGCQSDERLDIVSIDELQLAEDVELRVMSEFQPNRETYGTGTIGVFDEGGERVRKAFYIREAVKNIEEACPLPTDFWKVKWLMERGDVNQEVLGDLGECYYNQPEFIRENFMEICVPIFYEEPDLDHWTPEGYGTYPSETQLFASPGGNYTVYFFLHTSCGVETYQGFSVHVTYPKTVTDLEGKKTGVSVSQPYITGSVIPGLVLLSPVYPVYEMGHTVKVALSVRVARGTPVGTYAIGFDVGRAPAYNEALWLQEYGPKYQGKSSYAISRPQGIIGVFVQ